MKEITTIIAALGLFAFAVECYRREAARRRERLQYEIQNYWAVRRLHERREARESLEHQRRQALRLAHYKRYGTWSEFAPYAEREHEGEN